MEHQWYAGRTAIVTGGGGNIGTGICRRLAAEGARVAVVDIDEQAAAATAAAVVAAAGTAVHFGEDLRHRAAVDRSFAAAAAQLGEIDLLVNCVGVDHSLEPLEIDDDEWDLIMDTNVRSFFLTCQNVVRRWLGAGRAGAIVNIASVESVMPFPRQLHYASSKGAVQMLTRALAHDVARAGIRVNAVGPGTVPRRAESSEKYRGYVEQHPLGRLGTPDDIAAAVAFLGSDDASWITGQTLYVDGGWLVR
jgi:glucose 1-dehydrogenase/3-oxoacyl-[acyl-carrier protein] reductase